MNGSKRIWQRACLIAVVCVASVAFALVALAACASSDKAATGANAGATSGTNAGAASGAGSDGGHANATYVALTDGSLVGKAVHISGIVDYPYHEDGSSWQGYLISVDKVGDDLVTAWHEVAEGTESIADGSEVELWGTLESLTYTDTNDEVVDMPYITIEKIEVTVLAEAADIEDDVVVEEATGTKQ